MEKPRFFKSSHHSVERTKRKPLPSLFDSIILQYDLIRNYFHLEDLGKILVRGVQNQGDIAGHPALKEAYQLGAGI